MKKPFYVALICTGIIGVMAASMTTQAAWKSNSVGRWYTTNTTAKGYYIGWKKIGKHTYYFDKNGYAVTGWKYLKKDKKYWFFFDAKGRMLKSCWIDGYYLKANGTMATNTTINGITLDKNGNKVTTDQTTSSSSTQTSSSRKSCWVQVNNKYYYYTYTGKLAKGWLTIKNKTYYLDPQTGARKTGLIKVNKKYYYLDTKTGVCQKGWYTTAKGKTYYFDKNNYNALTKWQKISNNYYYFSKKGVLQKNKWIGKYYVNKNGKMVYGWVTIGNTKYYTNKKTGKRCTGWKLIKNKWYYFKTDGSMATNQWISGYYLKANGVMATKCWAGKYYVGANGKKTGKTRSKGFFTNKAGKTYYLDKNYEKIKGWKKIKGSYYYFNTKGVMQKNAWVSKYYVGSDGIRYINKFLTVKNSNGVNTTYFFGSTGIMATGLTVYNGNTYYFGSDGKMLTGWQTISGAKHYFNTSTGVMAVNTIIEIDGAYYSFDSNGVVEEIDAISIGKAIALYACKFIGNPYLYGGTSLTNGADCSGFTQSVMAHFGISIPRVASDQATGTSAYATAQYATAKTVSVNSLQPGDLVFYYSPISHVGIYIGSGLIVHASNSQPYPQGGIKVSAYNYTTVVKCIRYW